MTEPAMKSVLLVEDDKFLNELYAEALGQAGFKVTKVNDAQAALDELDNAPADILVLDIYLPINNAFEIIQQLQSYPDWQQLPIILISSQRLSSSQLPTKLKEQLSIVEFLYKPQTLPKDLVAAVQAAV